MLCIPTAPKSPPDTSLSLIPSPQSPTLPHRWAALPRPAAPTGAKPVARRGPELRGHHDFLPAAEQSFRAQITSSVRCRQLCWLQGSAPPQLQVAELLRRGHFTSHLATDSHFWHGGDEKGVEVPHRHTSLPSTRPRLTNRTPCRVETGVGGLAVQLGLRSCSQVPLEEARLDPPEDLPQLPGIIVRRQLLSNFRCKLMLEITKSRRRWRCFTRKGPNPQPHLRRSILYVDKLQEEGLLLQECKHALVPLVSYYVSQSQAAMQSKNQTHRHLAPVASNLDGQLLRRLCIVIL
mmetsp:Transcript_58965/g.105946  ORF Transcript_58965/g.105946 Transcript_58965/m.105946 type:complete len:292 (+) Transcript_58965:61-936(+)